MLTIWGRLNSHNVKKVVWIAEELGLPYRRHDVGGVFGMDDAYLAKNPNALIPTIEDDGVVLWESNAILRYLVARYGDDTMWPADPARRALADRWMDWQFGYADAQRDAFVNLVRRSADQRDEAAVERSAAACGRMMAVLDRHLAGTPWLSGDAFGTGDIPVGVYAHTYFALGLVRGEVPHVANWYARLQERPGYAANVMIPLT
ncbi:glutathione S-transferase [Sphingomonas sp. Leaf231]|uniref:glutathione S-transferase family protein n=1 Tax=Sphingomonas sp. Leaf231 TaxID=1736301 RepID=UPI0006FACC2C|nr:glutathione S-transferase family protein [Sphingomonas sp. Leaf231]KQN90453.1 glutathione S-transferase [Sphingomonas sp. Leaf231]